MFHPCQSVAHCVNLPNLRRFTKSYPFHESCANTVSSMTSVMCGIEATPSLSRAFSAHYEAVNIPGALPQAGHEPAPLALTRYCKIINKQSVPLSLFPHLRKSASSADSSGNSDSILG